MDDNKYDTFFDTYIMDYNFNDHPEKSELIRLAEAREKHWYIMFCKLNEEYKFDDGKTINKQNFGSAPKDWKERLKNFLRLDNQDISPQEDTRVIQLSDKDINNTLQLFKEIYSEDKIIELGFYLLGQEATQGHFAKVNKDDLGKFDVGEKISSDKMINGLRTELVKAYRRAEWAQKYNVDIQSSLAGKKGTYDLTFKGLREKEKGNRQRNDMTDIPFEVKTRLSSYHLASREDFDKKTLDDKLYEDGLEIEINKDSGNLVATLYINKNKLKKFVDDMIHSKLEATPVYESPRSLMLPSEVFASYENQGSLKVFLDDLKYMGAVVDKGKIINNITKKSLKYHVWYGRTK